MDAGPGGLVPVAMAIKYLDVTLLEDNGTPLTYMKGNVEGSGVHRDHGHLRPPA